MSKTISTKEPDSSSSDELGFEFYPRCAQEDFDVLSDKMTNESISDRSAFTKSDHLQTSIYPAIPQPDSFESWYAVNEVESLIASNISRDDDRKIQPCSDSEPNHSRTSNKFTSSQTAVQFKSPYYTAIQELSAATATNNTREERRPISNSVFYNSLQAITNEAGTESFKAIDHDYFNRENVPTFSRAFKKPSEPLANVYENSPEAQVKTKLRTMWNNMKYGWRIKREVNLKLDTKTWLLGQCYLNETKDGRAEQDVTKDLKLDLLSKILLTYRINFPTIPGTDIVSDSGWGCMVRCGQMMMAQALVCHFLHRAWRVTFDQPPKQKALYKMILRWFGDSLSENCIFSLHTLVSLGENYGRKAGDWYGPTHAAQVLRDALIQAKLDNPILSDVCMYVALDGIVFKQDVMDLCELAVTELPALENSNSKNYYPNIDYPELSAMAAQLRIQPVINLNHNSNSLNQGDIFVHQESKEVGEDGFSFIDPCPSYTAYGPPSFKASQSNWKSLILFVSVRLGNDKINPFYIPCLKSLLEYKNCIGIIGGRPKHALYFIGYQDDKLIHMDPHACQPAIDVDRDDFNVKSFQSSSIRTMSFSEMDPSCAIGFYFRTKEDFLQFNEKFSEITAPMKKNLDYPVFALAEGKRKDIEEVDRPHSYARSTFSHKSSKTDEDDYILL
ncbi:hypothetical protein JTE90_021725 [Oedothorax gibbosus]|uniref:Cysteine protease n=1 Tax=Oedothorax gibbosus TaxID=931172 RepID=A0AAV6UDY5_9ARAC|nr:hypothetical protein JTE90_021725 [Oedothorax gibbosus]